jgi:hypothetical protein
MPNNLNSKRFHFYDKISYIALDRIYGGVKDHIRIKIRTHIRDNLEDNNVFLVETIEDILEKNY